MTSKHIGLTLAVFVTILATNARGGDEARVVLPEGAFYYQPAVAAREVTAAWINPAALATERLAGWQLMADYRDGQFAESWGAVIYRDRMATAYRSVPNPDGDDFHEMITATGFRFGPAMKLGLAYRYFNSGPEHYHHRHLWTMGLSSQGRGPFALAAVFSNLNRGRLNGERTAVEQRYSVGYRPFGRKLTLAADAFLSSQNTLREADYVYHAEFTPSQGVYLTGLIDSDRNFALGVRVNLLKYFVGNQHHYSRASAPTGATVFVGATNARQPSVLSEPGRRLSVAIAGRLSENPARPIFGRRQAGFIDLVTTIYRAAGDKSISALSLSLERPSFGLGQAEELVEAIRYFRAHSKRVICHLTSPNNVGYFIASAADTILIPPVSQLRLVGLRAELTFWAGTLEHLGIRPDMLRVGKYKTAPEQYTERAATEANREQINGLLDDLYGQFVRTLAKGRHLSEDSIRQIIDSGPYTSEEALRFGLVDGLSYRDQIASDYFGSQASVSFRHYLEEPIERDEWRSKPVLAVVVAEGEIKAASGSVSLFGQPTGVTPPAMKRALARAKNNSAVRGVVLRINSPGGWAQAGDRIWHQAELAADSKPMVVSMSNVAASGGYYIATPAERIFANRATITGSIGIYGGKVDLSGLYDKIDLGKELFTRGRFAGMMSTTKPFTAEERDKYFLQLESFYDHFVGLVATNRQMPVDSIDNLSRGRVWTGQAALANGLVDEPGGIKQALDYLATGAGIDEYDLVIYPQRRSWWVLPGGTLFDRILSLFSGSKESATASSAALNIIDAESGIFARLPFDITIE